MPCYLFTVLPAPYFKKYGKRPWFDHICERRMTAAAVDAITAAVLVLAGRSMVDIPIALAAMGLIRKGTKLPGPVIVAAAAAIGFMAFSAVHG